MVVQEGKGAEVVTSQCPKAWDTISYQLNDGEEEEANGGGCSAALLACLLPVACRVSLPAPCSMAYRTTPYHTPVPSCNGC